MTANRRTRITIESERVVIVTAKQSQGRCEQCGQEVNFSKLSRPDECSKPFPHDWAERVATSFVSSQMGINSRSV